MDLSAAKAPELSPPEPGPEDWSVAPDVGPSDSGQVGWGWVTGGDGGLVGWEVVFFFLKDG